MFQSQPPNGPHNRAVARLRTDFNAAWRRDALAGNREAVAVLAETVLQPLYAFCFYRVGRNQHLCEEVVQETLLHAIRDLEHYDPQRSHDNIFPWLTGLARNEIQRTLGREKNALALQTLWDRMDRELLSLYALLDSEPFTEDVLVREETCELVNATMSQLPSHYREALEAKYVAGKSVRDLAESWQTTEKAVESQLTRARKAFRATFLALCRHLGDPEPIGNI